MPNRVYLSLGSNIAPEKNLVAALRLLQQSLPVLAVSPVYETAPAGPPGQPNFLNAAALITTHLEAARLKTEILAPLEQALGRVRTADRNAPRTIDVDVVLFNDAVFDLGRRHIPDPDLLRYPHVAVPIAHLAPDLRHPETGETLAENAARLLRQAAAEGRPPIRLRPDLILWGS